MSTRTVRYLLQTDPTYLPAQSLSQSPTYTFDLRLVGAVAMKELIQTCRSGTPMTSVIHSLLVGKTGKPLVWRGNGPGVGWEMRSAWSGLFGRFFARAYLEEQGYTWFHPMEKVYDRISNDFVVTRVSKGEIADWVCAKDISQAKSGDILIVEAKGRHREGHLKLHTLPRPLRDALEQLKNTVVHMRDGNGVLNPKSTKGYAILTKWTNEAKGPKANALLRVVDPETYGSLFSDVESRHAVSNLGRGHISRMITGLGFDGLGYVTSPVTTEFDINEAAIVLQEVAELIDKERSENKIEQSIESIQTNVVKPQTRIDKATGSMAKNVELEIKRMKNEKLIKLSSSEIKKLKEQAKAPQTTVRIKSSGLDNEEFVGELFGISGPIRTPLPEAIEHIKKLPEDMASQFVFVGIRSPNIEAAVLNDEFSNWIYPQDDSYTKSKGIFAFRDGVVVAPAPFILPTQNNRSFYG